jgi:hypothetical protein
MHVTDNGASQRKQQSEILGTKQGGGKNKVEERRNGQSRIKMIDQLHSVCLKKH